MVYAMIGITVLLFSQLCAGYVPRKIDISGLETSQVGYPPMHIQDSKISDFALPSNTFSDFTMSNSVINNTRNLPNGYINTLRVSDSLFNNLTLSEYSLKHFTFNRSILQNSHLSWIRIQGVDGRLKFINSVIENCTFAMFFPDYPRLGIEFVNSRLRNCSFIGSGPITIDMDQSTVYKSDRITFRDMKIRTDNYQIVLRFTFVRSEIFYRGFDKWTQYLLDPFWRFYYNFLE